MNRKLKELQEEYEALKTENWILKKEKEAFERVIGYYKRDFKQLLETYKEQKKDYETLFTAKQGTEKRLTETNKYKDKYFDLFVRKVVHNKEKGTTVVWFYKNDKIIVKRRKGAKDDVYTAVAYAIAEKLYGSNTRFKKAVEDVKM